MIWEGVAGALLLGLLGGLATIAYKHPKGYARVHDLLWRALTVVLVLCFVFMIGVQVGQSNMWEFISPDKFADAWANRLPLRWAVIYPFGIYAATMLYLGFLRRLPKLVDREDEYEPEDGIVIPVRLIDKGDSDKQTRKPSSTKRRR